MEEYRGFPCFYAEDAAAWRSWLSAHFAQATGIWLIIYRKESPTPSVYYPEAVDEALCFGWVDSKPNKRDAESYYQYFSKRNPKSNWSGFNKAKIERLSALGKLAAPGLEMVALAKVSGTWTALDGVERLEVPADLAQAFDAYPKARSFWDDFPPSVRRGILEWIFNAKRAETREKRIATTAQMASRNQRANQFR